MKRARARRSWVLRREDECLVGERERGEWKVYASAVDG